MEKNIFISGTLISVKPVALQNSEICVLTAHNWESALWKSFSKNLLVLLIKGELNPTIDFSSFEHLGIVEQLYEVFFLSCLPSSSEKFDVL